MAVTFHNLETDFKFTNKRIVASWIKDTLRAEGFGLGAVSIIFCSREEHLRINRTFLDHDYPTDVITFDSGEGDPSVISGDVFIDNLTVAGNARRFGTDPRQEMHRVIIHGILHLCGYRDKNAEEEKIMRATEDKYLAELNKTYGL